MAPTLGQPLSRADATWLHAESPTNHFVVTSLALLDRPVPIERLRAVLERRLHLHPRLTQVVAETPIPLAAGRTLRPRRAPAPGGAAEPRRSGRAGGVRR